MHDNLDFYDSLVFIIKRFVTNRLGMVNEMKKSTQISGLPIINISDGNQVGKVKSLVINPDKGSVDFLTIEHEDWQVSVKAIPFKKVVGIGEYAVTIESENAVIDLNEIPIANQLVNKKIKITNTKVMTRKGELIGDVQEYFVDQDTGNILGMQLTAGSNQVALSSELVVTFGKDIIIVQEDATAHFLDSVEQLKPTEVEITIEGISTEEIKEDTQINDLKFKQIELLSGKKLIKDVLDKNGNILFHEGKILVAEDIERAQQEGPGVVIDLSMNVEI
jgi:uncharacterized protein YrrD